MGLSPETRSGFAYSVASGIRFGFWRVCGTHREMQECAIVLGSCSFRESREKSGSTLRLAGRSWKPGGVKVFIFLLVSRECSQGKERLIWV